jgi:hypothetical protein
VRAGATRPDGSPRSSRLTPYRPARRAGAPGAGPDPGHTSGPRALHLPDCGVLLAGGENLPSRPERPARSGHEPIMLAYLRRGTHRNTAARLRRLIAALAVVTCGVLGWAGAVPAASASIIPVPGRPLRARPRPRSPGDRSRRHARRADHPDRGRRRAGRGHRRGGPGPRAGQLPGPLHRMTPRRPAPDPAGPGPRPRSRPGLDCQAGRRQACPHPGLAPEHSDLSPPRRQPPKNARPDIACRMSVPPPPSVTAAGCREYPDGSATVRIPAPA